MSSKGNNGTMVRCEFILVELFQDKDLYCPFIQRLLGMIMLADKIPGIINDFIKQCGGTFLALNAYCRKNSLVSLQKLCGTSNCNSFLLEKGDKSTINGGDNWQIGIPQKG